MLASHARGQEFKSLIVHHALMAKLVDALASGASEEIHESSSLSKSTIKMKGKAYETIC